ncbi:TolC family protein [Agaribacterium sp. ZY112]|uniref:TolC family protein n=1 Tax=Agaribacterium sp. ZY112 TaxID=3233574 RepID=UPI003523E76F
MTKVCAEELDSSSEASASITIVTSVKPEQEVSSVFSTALESGLKPTALKRKVIALELKQAIDLALANNYQLQFSSLEPELAKQALDLARAVHEPEFFASYSQSQGRTQAAIVDLPKGSEQEVAATGLRGQSSLGTRWNLGVDATAFDASVPSAQGSGYFTSVEVVQPLLKGAGRAAANSDVRLAKNGEKISRLQLEQALMHIVVDVVFAYVDVYAAEQSLVIAKQNRDLAKQTLDEERERHRLGRAASSDLYRPDATYALRQDAVIRAEQNLRFRENRLKALISNEQQDLLTYSIDVGQLPRFKHQMFDAASDFEQALKMRPDFRIAELQKNNSQVELDRDKRNRLPQLDLVLRYQGSGLSGDADFSSAYDNYRANGQDGHYLGVNFSVPITNKRGRSQTKLSEIKLSQSRIELKRFEQQILLDLDTSAFQVENERLRVEAAKRSVLLAEQTLKAEEEKMAVGRSTSFYVLDLQSRLAAAQSQHLSAEASYLKSVAEYFRQNGSILKTYGIEVASL